MGGVRSGAGTTVGAGPVVRKNVAPREIVAGNPARPLVRRARPGLDPDGERAA